MEVGECAVWLLLGINTIRDIKKQEIFPRMTLVFLAVGILLSLWQKKSTVLFVLLSLLPGLFLIAVGKISRESVGFGDGLVLLAVGSCLGLWRTLKILCFASVTAVPAAGILWYRSRDKNQRIPFLPFLLLGYLAERCL